MYHLITRQTGLLALHRPPPMPGYTNRRHTITGNRNRRHLPAGSNIFRLRILEAKMRLDWRSTSSWRSLILTVEGEKVVAVVEGARSLAWNAAVDCFYCLCSLFSSRFSAWIRFMLASLRWHCGVGDVLVMYKVFPRVQQYLDVEQSIVGTDRF